MISTKDKGNVELSELTLNRVRYIKNAQDIELILKENNTNFYSLYDLISRRDILISDDFDVKREYDGLHPHVLLKPTQSGLDLQAISFEIGDNSTDANCKILEYKFLINENKLVDIICSDDGDGIKEHDIKRAVAYGGYFGKKEKNKSGKFMEGLSNVCGTISGTTYIYTNTGDGSGWYKSVVDFTKLKNMIKVYEDNITKLSDSKADIYRGISYKYMANSYIDQPMKINIDEIKHMVNGDILDKGHGTIIVFKNCYKDIIDDVTLDSEIEKLKVMLGRRYWKDIDTGIKINVINRNIGEYVKSIDIMMRNKECNYREAINTKYFELNDMFKVSDFTGNMADNDYLPLSLSIKEKTDLYYYNANRKKPGAPKGKIRVPNILAIASENQGLSVERNNRPISDTLPFGAKPHPDYNGVFIELCIDSRLDEIFFVTGDKSRLSSRQIDKVIGKKLSSITSQIKDIKANRKEKISYINSEGKRVEIVPTVFKYEPVCDIEEEQTGDDQHEVTSITDYTEQININNGSNETDNNSKDSGSDCIDIGGQLIINTGGNDNQNISIDNDNEEENYINDTQIMIGKGDSSWTAGLVFAANNKSECRFDVVNNTMKYKKNDKSYLVFDDEISMEEGIKVRHLKKWWSKQNNTSTTLENKMNESIREDATFQKLVFNTYKNKIESSLGDKVPALLPEVELYHNSYTKKQNPDSEPQRMDFCLVLKNRKMILIELDGIQHVSAWDNRTKKWIASESKYAKQCQFDNDWKLDGNEIYRISNKTFKDLDNENKRMEYIENFFIRLFKKHGIIK